MERQIIFSLFFLSLSALNFAGTDKSTKLLTDFEWVRVDAGSFMMRCSSGDNDSDRSHNVTLDTYYISKYEITGYQYNMFCKETGRREQQISGKTDGEKPVSNISWYDAMEFCKWLSSKTGSKISLPTEAQWEFAARGGNFSKGYDYSGSNNPYDVGWYRICENVTWGKPEKNPMTIQVKGIKKPNELGIYDMTGNVSEWCYDWYDAVHNNLSADSSKKPVPTSCSKVIRGGSYIFPPVKNCERYFNAPPAQKFEWVGFRIVKKIKNRNKLP